VLSFISVTVGAKAGAARTWLVIILVGKFTCSRPRRSARGSYPRVARTSQKANSVFRS